MSASFFYFVISIFFGIFYYMITKLAIEQSSDTKDSRFLRIIDNSWYNPDIQVECAILEITLPGKDCAVAFNVEKNFNSVFNSKDLEVKKPECNDKLIPLPEGVYKIKYSIKPNNILYEEYYILFNEQQLENYSIAICELFSERNALTKKEFDDKVNDLFWIKFLITSAKDEVESCGNMEKGLELYDEAKELLRNFTKRCKSC